MKLYLVQHGEACPKDVDPERPLTVKGRKDVGRIAQFLHQKGINIDRIIHSGKLRADQTAEILASRIAPDVILETSDMLDPHDDPAIFNWRDDGREIDTLIVGHLPFMAKLASRLLINDMEKTILAYLPGSIVCLEFVDDRWQLNWMIRPELMEP